MKTLDLSFLLPISTALEMDEKNQMDVVGEDLSNKCHKAAELIESILPGDASYNLSETEADHDIGCYIDDLNSLSLDLEKAGIKVIWPNNEEPHY
jgi:hypothetical protein